MKHLKRTGQSPLDEVQSRIDRALQPLSQTPDAAFTQKLSQILSSTDLVIQGARMTDTPKPKVGFHHRAWEITEDDGLITDHHLTRTGMEVVQDAADGIGTHLMYREEFGQEKFDNLVLLCAAGWPWSYSLGGAGMHIGFTEAEHVFEFLAEVSGMGNRWGRITWESPSVEMIRGLGFGDEILITGNVATPDQTAH